MSPFAAYFLSKICEKSTYVKRLNMVIYQNKFHSPQTSQPNNKDLNAKTYSSAVFLDISQVFVKCGKQANLKSSFLIRTLSCDRGQHVYLSTADSFWRSTRKRSATNFITLLHSISTTTNTTTIATCAEDNNCILAFHILLCK